MRTKNLGIGRLRNEYQKWLLSLFQVPVSKLQELLLYVTLVLTEFPNQCAGILLDMVSVTITPLECAIRNILTFPNVEFPQASTGSEL